MNAQPNTEAKRVRREDALHGEVALLRQQKADLLAALKALMWKLDIPQQTRGLARELFTARAAIARAEGGAA